MRIDFNEKEHIYSLNGNIANISVTELLRKHGLAPNYSGVSEKVLKLSAEVGKAVHKDLELVFNEANYEPKTIQGENFAKWVGENLQCGVGEQMLGYEKNGWALCGTADVMAIAKDGALIIGDHKNTSSFNKEYVSWQVSLLDYMARKLGKSKLNGQALNWKGATRFYCFHYDKDTGDLDVKDLEKVPDSEIEKLIECELKGEIYQRPVLVIDAELQEKVIEAERELANIEFQYKQAKENADKMREALKKAFEEQNIKSWESPSGLVKATYIEAQDKVSVDSKKLKQDYPTIYSNCLKNTHTKSYIKITIRANEEF